MTIQANSYKEKDARREVEKALRDHFSCPEKQGQKNRGDTKTKRAAFTRGDREKGEKNERTAASSEKGLC